MARTAQRRAPSASRISGAMLGMRPHRLFFTPPALNGYKPATISMVNSKPGKPVVRHIASLWTLRDTPSSKKPWSLEQKIAAVKEAGFDGFADLATPRHAKFAEKYGLVVVGGFASARPDDFRALLQQNLDAGARHISVQLGSHDTATSDAVRMALRLMHEGSALGVLPAVEICRGTSTETPEKAYALADGFQRIAAKLLPLAWDFSHFAVVKQLNAPFAERLLVRPDLIQLAAQFHFRPFNGHHCQLPVTDGRGRISDECSDWLPLVKKCLQLWLRGNQAGREIFLLSKLGPVSSGYNLGQSPDSWTDAIKLRGLLDKIWTSLPGTASGKAK